ncbi:amidohydrolase family protein [uncultured Sphingomonas sp.]|uniref:amidohydrolase family protein n=1 Tax=uncultured Sphingomonas sp. TaxID=158754 RepID=UPI0035CB3DBA
MANRIDVHQHVLPPFWVEGLRERSLSHRPPPWSPEAALAFMDANDISTGILSLTAPGLTGWADGELAPMSRRVNEYTAELAARWPERFGGFAYVPMPDVEASIAEATYALDVLGADGITLLSNYGDQYLGDESFEPLWEQLDRRSAIVFVHPTRLSQPELKGIPAPFVDFPFATTRAAVEMVMRGVLDRHRRISIILAHGGGFLPYTAYRFATFAASGPPGSTETATFETDTAASLATFRRYFLDTALTSSPTSLPALKAFADPSHILFGSDFPYAPGGTSRKFTSMLEESDLLTPDERLRIDRENARQLFGPGVGWGAIS